jgi:hypothetical protein
LSISLHSDVAHRLPSLVVVHGDHSGTPHWRSLGLGKAIGGEMIVVVNSVANGGRAQLLLC